MQRAHRIGGSCGAGHERNFTRRRDQCNRADWTSARHLLNVLAMHTGVPQYSITDAARILQEAYGLSGHVSELPSERDQNFLVRDNERAFVLKIANANESLGVLEAENAVMRHVGATALCPHIVPLQNGDAIGRDGIHSIRLISALAGQPLGHTAWHTAPLRRDIGRSLALLDRELQALDLPAFHRHFHWDLAHAADLVDANLSLVTDDSLPVAGRGSRPARRRSVGPARPQG